jgi:hypothetical protein
LLRPLVGELPRKLVVAIAALGGLSAVLAIISSLTVDGNVVAVAIHVLLALSIPALLRWPSAVRWVSLGLILLVVLESALGRSGIDFAVDTVYVAGAAIWFGVTLLSAGVPSAQWRTTNFRLGPLSLTLGGLIALAGAVQLALSGVGFDRRLYETLFGISLLAIVALPVAVTVLAGFMLSNAEPGRTYRYGSAGIALGFLAWSALAAVPPPAPLPIPGVALLANASADGTAFPLLLSPQRPGRNLVHFPDSAGADVSVGVAGGLVTPATAGRVRKAPGRSSSCPKAAVSWWCVRAARRLRSRWTPVSSPAPRSRTPMLRNAPRPRSAGSSTPGVTCSPLARPTRCRRKTVARSSSWCTS